MSIFKIKTLGCKVNQYESQQIREELLGRGFFESNNGEKAEIYLINTCTVTQRCDAKSLALIRDAIEENPEAQILVTGCFAKAEARQIKKIFGKKVDIATGPVNKILEPPEAKFADIETAGISDFKGHSRAFIKIQDGCDNHCSYCKIPLVRGVSQSRDSKEIIEEAHRLINKGYKELILCGICLGSYGKDLKSKLNLSNIIRSLIEINADFRIRLSSIEAKDATDEVIKIMKDSKKLCPHLHIPFQSGDDSVLMRMNRKYTSRDYLDIVERIRRKIPKIAITTDIMAGFPGEAEENFENTLSFLKKIEPARIHCFPFSPRPATAAFKLKDKVYDKIIQRRMSLLLELAKQMSYNYQAKFIGKELDVLIEKKPDKETGFNRGYSENYIYTLVQAKDLTPGQIIKVKATNLNSHYLVAKVATNPY